MLNLLNVTLVFVATRAHEITKMVIDDCLNKARFGEVLIYTDDASRIVVPGACYVSVPDWQDKKAAGQFYYGVAAAGVTTDFCLMMEWDGGIFDTSKWRSDFFDYDYIGAPWITADDHKVGNGGFTLMSRRLGQFLLAEQERFPVCTDVDVCRTYRTGIETAGGFRWPDSELASCFAWELGPRNSNNFGFHGVFHWPTMLERADVIKRAWLMTASPYLVSKLRPLVLAAPWLKDEVLLPPIVWQQQYFSPRQLRRKTMMMGRLPPGVTVP